VTSAREALLGRCVELLQETGFSDLSLREIAARVGTSHRMLIYHFGSRELLLAEIVVHIEGMQREAFADLASSDVDPVEAGRQFWRRISDPSLAPAERLFFEIYSHALYQRPWTARFRETVIAPWAKPLTDLLISRGYPPEEAQRRARLGIAATRGLLLDLLVTGDRDLIDSASDLLSRMLIDAPPG
jgi:AcrR family transcriptional regulator